MNRVAFEEITRNTGPVKTLSLILRKWFPLRKLPEHSWLLLRGTRFFTYYRHLTQKKKNQYVYTPKSIFLLWYMALGVRERKKRAKSFCVYCHDTRIMTFRTALGLRGKGAFVYSFRSLMPDFSGAQVSSNCIIWSTSMCQKYRITDGSSSKGS